MKFVNLTPHAIVVENGPTFEPSGSLARCEETREQVGTFEGLPIGISTYGEVQGLPDPAPDTVYIVSMLVLAQVPDRPDVFAPGPAVRDDKGRVIACKGLTATPRGAAHIRRGLEVAGYGLDFRNEPVRD